MFVTTGRGNARKYCFKCSPVYSDDKTRAVAITALRRAVKIKLVKIKGCKCEICGYNKCIAALEFHHVDPSKKEISISLGTNFSEQDIKNLVSEIDKCILVCSNCHREIHSSMDFYHY